MANNNYINKVIYGNDTLIDLTGDTITASDLASGKTAHDRSGAIITGTNTNDADTSDADALAGEILATKTAYVNGSKVTGSMPNRGSVTGSIATKAGTYSIQNGYHDGSGTVGIDSTEQDKIIPTNILSCCPKARTPASPAIPIATPAPKDDNPQHKPLAKCLHPK